jgi:hypothetical protein
MYTHYTIQIQSLRSFSELFLFDQDKGCQMSFAILRIKKHSNFGTISGIGSHVMRTRNTPNANPKLTPKNKTLIGSVDMVADVKARLASAKIGSVRKNGVIGIEHMLTASPEYFQGPDIQKRFNQWFAASKSWLFERYGQDNVVSLTVHLDESTPHVHAMVVPIEKKASGRFAGQERLNARAFTGGREKMSEMQDSYAAALSLTGLERGIKGSKARHTTIKSWYSEANQDVQRRQALAEQAAQEKLKGHIIDVMTHPGKHVAEYQADEIHELSNQISILKREKQGLEMEKMQKEPLGNENQFKPS